MDFLLVFPYSKTHYCVPPLGLAYLAGSLRRAGFDVDILDCTKENIRTEELASRLTQFKPRFVGFQLFSYDLPEVRSCIEVTKKVLPDTLVVVGGAHPSGAPDLIFDHLPLVDYAFHGEAESGLVLLGQREIEGRSITNDNIPGLIYRQAGKTLSTPAYFEPNLDNYGLPAWDLINPRDYQNAPQGVFLKSTPVAPISTSRGCPYPCSYCAGKTITGARIRKRSIQSVLDEIEMLHNDYDIREIHIVDDHFTADRKRVLEFCKGLEQRGLHIYFTFPNGVRLDSLDEELLKILKKSGCYSMIVGIESGCDRVLKDMRKKLTVEEIRKGVARVKNSGIDISGFFILGYPTDTRESILETIAFSKSLGLNAAHFSNFLPLPGTPATKQLQQEGKLLDTDASNLFYSRVVYVPEGMTKKELKSLQRRAYLGFYLRPLVLFRLLKKVKGPSHMLAIFKRLSDYLFRS
jgi:anaerobic magnesium-protoporphyrin IX monomethyl ester cyclase